MSPPSGGTPEERARVKIDAALEEAGWAVQDRDLMNLAAARGVAVREFKLARGHGHADYLLFIDGKAVGVLEAKPEGHTLSGVEPQAAKYSAGLPANLKPPVRPLPFLYLSTGTDTRFTNLLDLRPKSRRIFQVHRPETIAEWLSAETLYEWVKALHADGPRRFFDLFSLRLGSGRPLDRKRDGKVLDREGWCGKGPRVPMHYLSYIEREKLAADEIRPLLFEAQSETGADR